METLEYDHAVFNTQSAEADRSLAVRFFTLPVQDVEATAEQGRPIFKDVEHVEIRVRGDRNSVVHKPVDEGVKRRFSAAWQQHAQGQQVLQSGTPLGEWPGITRAQIEELRYFGFQTVEHLAEARDDVVARFPGLTSLKQRARNFLELAKGAAPLERMQAALETATSEKEALAAQVADLGKRLAVMEAKGK